MSGSGAPPGDRIAGAHAGNRGRAARPCQGAPVWRRTRGRPVAAL